MVQRRGHALTASTIANANRKKGVRAFGPEVFMPDFSKERPSRDQTTEEQISIVEALNISLKGRDLRKNKVKNG